MKQTTTTHWSVVLDIIDAGLARDPEKVRNYAELLAGRLEEVGDAAIAKRIRQRLHRAPSATRPAFPGTSATQALSPQNVFAPVDPESRSPFTDEVTVLDEEPLILPMAARSEVDRLINLRRRADEFLRAGIPVARSLLLYGPPGCGKTSTARYLAWQLRLPLLILRLDSVMSSYLGTTAKNLRSVFEHAARRGGILFLDEFDAVAKMRDDANEVGEIKRIVNSLIQNLDAFPRLFVVAATNHEHLLDPAIWRRFDAAIRLPLPGLDERRQLLGAFLPNPMQWDPDYTDCLALLTEGLSGADIARVVLRARQEAVLRADVSLLHLLTIEIWRHIEGMAVTSVVCSDDKLPLLQFLETKTGGQLPSRTLAALAGISHTTVVRMRHTEGELLTHA